MLKAIQFGVGKGERVMSQVQQHPQHHVTGWTGWIVFASVLMFIAGVMHILYGLGAVNSQDWYVYASGTAYLFDASDWGWSMVVGGVLLILSGALLMAGNMIGRVIAALLLIGSVLINIALLPVAPVWSIGAIVIDVLILYAVIAHGGEMKHLDE